MWRRCYHKLKEVFTMFANNTPIHGFQYLTRKDISKLENWIWTGIVSIFIAYMSYTCYNLYTGFYSNPTVTTLVSTHFSVTNIPLPAIGICSNNKLSKSRVASFVTELSKRFNKSEQWLNKQVLWMGRLYDFELYGEDQRIEMQEMIDVLLKDKTYPISDIRFLMDSLAVSCDDLLVECYWMGEKRNCKELFVRRLTNDGFCCMFNYIRPIMKSAVNVHIPPLTPINSSYKATSFDYNNGLKILINNMPEDYLYSDLMFEGVLVQIFRRDIFPDSSNGDVTDVFCGMGYEAFLTLTTQHIKAEAPLKKYPKEIRGCVLDTEKISTYGTNTMSDCLVGCKIKAILALCGCIPFVIPYDEPHTVCTLLDIACLNKYKEKISTLYPYSIETNDLDHEKEDSIKCECYPSCSRTDYNVHANYAQLNLRRNKSWENTHSFIHIFYAQSIMDLYETDVVMYWFELLSNIGGLCGLLLGVSVISIIEMFYYFLIFLYNIFTIRGK